MSRESIPPTETPSSFDSDGIVRKHPAFGVIVANRRQGRHVCFGSPIEHHATISITIKEAEEHFSLHYSRPFAGKIIAEVVLSEAQWARFVSTPNVGEGVPCTINYMRNGDGLIAPPLIEQASDHDKRTADIKATTKKMVAQYQAAVDALDALTKQPKVSKADLARVRAMFLHPVDYAGSNAQFFANSITEHMEHVETTVKSEIDAYLTQVAMKFPAITGAMPTVPQLDKPKDGQE